MEEYNITHYLDDNQSVELVESDYEKDVEKKIQEAKTPEEISDIISDALVKSLLDQLDSLQK